MAKRFVFKLSWVAISAPASKTTQQSAAKAPNARNREQRLLKGIIGCKAGEATQADDAMLYDAWGADANGGSAAGGARGVGSKRDVRGQGTGEGAVVRARNGTDRSAKLTSYALGAPMALPGQSYNPEQGDHEEAVAEAVALELKREDAVKAANAPIAQGLSAETLALLVGDDEGSSSDEDSGDDGDDGDITLAKKQTGKMTRAERNKQKRRKAAELDVKRRKAAKSSTHEQHRIKAIGAELEQQAKDRAEARKAKQMLKANKDGVPLKDADVMQAPSIPVNLAEELSGSLRQMRTRGSLLVDRVAMLKRVGVHPDKQKAAARAKMEKKPKKRFKFQERYKDFD
ncbi:ribosome biogenesis protein Nop53/GLTSCR2 [Tribonema minus]|uniref:Ribosome biogenesis protein NOP53 n=1 Tax=Tribonema minus TaxID=303371 RepID=A0A835YY73_9STRA|nr:ribosome biogenesis protein Nop53/GLTSCR2 [Tribonema minus]